jgi:DNA-binding CsgD family transcriptional regulator
MSLKTKIEKVTGLTISQALRLSGVRIYIGQLILAGANPTEIAKELGETRARVNFYRKSAKGYEDACDVLLKLQS